MAEINGTRDSLEAAFKPFHMGWSAYDINANADCGLSTFQVPCLTNALTKYTARRALADELEIPSLAARHHATNTTKYEGPLIPLKSVVLVLPATHQLLELWQSASIALGCIVPLLRSLIGTCTTRYSTPESRLNLVIKKFEFSVFRNTVGRNFK